VRGASALSSAAYDTAFIIFTQGGGLEELKPTAIKLLRMCEKERISR
jgi:hypothetical protein